MKGVFINYSEINSKKMTGIDKKVMSQIFVFNKAGLNCKLVSLISKKRTLDKIISRLPFGNALPKWEFIYDFVGLDFVYFRRPACVTGYLRKTLSEIRKKNKNIKIIYELPTYPYDKEICRRKIDWPILIKDRYNRIRLKGLVDRIAVLTDDKIIFGIPTIKITNGVDLDNIKVKKSKKTKNEINICAVANFANWHGYDRFIEGLGRYYANGGKKNIILNLVGEGREKKRYQNIVAYYNINKNVLFHGFKSGVDLDKIYNEADIAIDILGKYRTGDFIAYTLKSREYLAKGIPIISGCKLDLLKEEKNFKYFLEFKNDGSPIDINRVIAFYNNIYLGSETKEEIIKNIREFANKTCDINVAMKRVVDYIKSEK
jgi:hypothetical protein